MDGVESDVGGSGLFFREFNAEHANVVVLFGRACELVHADEGYVDHFFDAARLSFLQEVGNIRRPQLVALGVSRLGEPIGEKHELHAIVYPNFTFAEHGAFEKPQSGGSGNRRLVRFALAGDDNRRRVSRSGEGEPSFGQIKVNVAGRSEHCDIGLTENAEKLPIEGGEKKRGRIGQIGDLLHQPP